MPRISAVDPESFDEPMAKIAADPFYNLITHRPEIAECYAQMDKAFMGPSSKLPMELKEEARRALSQDAGCKLCASFGKPKPNHEDRRESLAAAFAEAVVQDHQGISDGTFDVLKEEFTEEEIVELVSWICFKFGNNVFGNLMRLNAGSDEEIKNYQGAIAAAS